MKFYLASAYAQKDFLTSCAQDLISMGHEVTSTWLVSPKEAEDELIFERKQEIAQENMRDLREANVIICFTFEARHAPARGGRHVELGLALGGDEIDIIVVGPRENVFYYLPGIEQFHDWSHALAYILGKYGRSQVRAEDSDV